MRRIGFEFLMISHPKINKLKDFIWVFGDFSSQNASSEGLDLNFW
jgi:hypothetical protein